MLLSLNAFTLIIVLGIVGGVISLTAVIVILLTEKEIDYLEVERRRSELEGLLNESKFLQLSSQIRPHFLFNTLNVISTLIRLDKKREAEQATHAISFLLRYHLKDEGPLVSLQEELEYVRHYLTIQKLRFGKRLQWKIEVPQEVMNLPIPLLTVQPLVENACNHGIEPAVSGGEIQLAARYDKEGTLWIEVKDNGVGIVEEVEQEFVRWKDSREAVPDNLRIGICNVHSRLIHQFGDQSGLTIRRLEQGTLSQIKICYKEAAA